MTLWPAPLQSSHCYSSPPSLALCLTGRSMFLLMMTNTWRVPHVQWGQQHKTHQSPLTLLLFPLSPSPFVSVFTTFLLSLCSSVFELRETVMCLDNRDSGRGGETLQFLYDHGLKRWLSEWWNGWWQSISSQLSGSHTVSGDQSLICDE